jgi:pyridoxal phosphate enzyme (YggS family)
MAAAAGRAGRSPSEVTLVAVSKMFGAGAVREAHAAGQREFGENKVQEGLQKIADTADTQGIRWHLIGHLQTNKARKAAAAFACVQSVDSLDLIRRLDTAAAEQGTAPEVLIQVDLAGETSKFGALPAAVESLVRSAADARALRPTGLMLIPPWNEDPEVTRPWFIRLRELRDRLFSTDIPPAALAQLSMGMSHDFEAAIEEGATIVRVGTAIFGARR